MIATLFERLWLMLAQGQGDLHHAGDDIVLVAALLLLVVLVLIPAAALGIGLLIRRLSRRQLDVTASSRVSQQQGRSQDDALDPPSSHGPDRRTDRARGSEGEQLRRPKVDPVGLIIAASVVAALVIYWLIAALPLEWP